MAEARDYLAQTAPTYDLVLADLRLPDGSGLELLNEIREQALPVAVVVLTGSGDAEAVVAALKAGADDYLVKPAITLPVCPRHSEPHSNARAQRPPAKPARLGCYMPSPIRLTQNLRAAI